MSVLLVHLVPQGILFGADRTITVSLTQSQGGFVRELVGQTLRPKVLKWPNREFIIGYLGEGRVAGLPTDQWLTENVIGRNLGDESLRSIAHALTDQLNAEMERGRLRDHLLVHLAGFEYVGDFWRPEIWFVRNTAGLSSLGEYLPDTHFACSEEVSRADRFGDASGNEIRRWLAASTIEGGLFSFRQAGDLATFNSLDAAVRGAIRAIIASHPARPHREPETLDEWAKHVRMAVLTFAAYYEAFREPYERVVGGGADVVWARWPD